MKGPTVVLGAWKHPGEVGDVQMFLTPRTRRVLSPDSGCSPRWAKAPFQAQI